MSIPEPVIVGMPRVFESSRGEPEAGDSDETASGPADTVPDVAGTGWIVVKELSACVEGGGAAGPAVTWGQAEEAGRAGGVPGGGTIGGTHW